MPKVYDCFTFFNELDVLEIRLNELADVVDRFVVVEATKTYQGSFKPLYYADHARRFRPFTEKIRHIVVDFPADAELLARYPGASAAWAREYFQRDMILKGLADCEPTDVVIISDVDEIPRATKVREYISHPGIKIFKQRLYYYWLNCECIGTTHGREYPWLGSVMVPYWRLTTPQRIRNLCISTSREYLSRWWLVRVGSKVYRKVLGLVGGGVTIVEDGGWHFSYLGGVESIREKLLAFAHTELVSEETLDLARVGEAVKRGSDLFGRDLLFRFVHVDGSFPEYVVRHIERFRHLIGGGGKEGEEWGLGGPGGL